VKRAKLISCIFDLFESVPYRSSAWSCAVPPLPQIAASLPQSYNQRRNRLRLAVCSSIATNVTYAVVVCLRSPVRTFSEWTSTPTSHRSMKHTIDLRAQRDDLSEIHRVAKIDVVHDAVTT